jgi:hypothetical protein
MKADDVKLFYFSTMVVAATQAPRRLSNNASPNILVV